MKINMEQYLWQELNLLGEYINETRDWKRIDEMAFESIKTFGGKSVILVIYPELLRYGYVYREGVSGDKKTYVDHAVVWLACKIELEGEQSTDWHSDVLKELKEYVKEKFPWKPFYDEDACHGIYSRQCSPYSRDWTKYVFYVNPHFPNGWWENHALG